MSSVSYVPSLCKIRWTIESLSAKYPSRSGVGFTNTPSSASLIEIGLLVLSDLHACLVNGTMQKNKCKNDSE